MEPERTTVPNVPTLPLRRPHVVAPVRLVGATPPAIEAVSTAMPGAAEAGRREAREQSAGLLAAPGLRRPRDRAPMVTLADPGAPSAGVHAGTVDARRQPPQLPALERASAPAAAPPPRSAALAIPTGARSAVPTGRSRPLRRTRPRRSRATGQLKSCRHRSITRCHSGEQP